MSSTKMQEFLKEKGVSEQKVILSFPDDSPNKTLSLLKRKGYTEFNNYDSVLKNKKADYLVLGNDSWKQNEHLNNYLNDSIGYFNGITLYKLK
jgi:hypothetical protein